MPDEFPSPNNCSLQDVICGNCSDTFNCSWRADVQDMQRPDPAFEAFQTASRFWIQRVLVPLIMVVGVVGNTATIFIMTQRRMRSSTNWYLAALATFDAVYLTFSFLLSLSHYPDVHAEHFLPYWRLWPAMLTVTDAASNASIWITVTFTVERYVAVCHPMRGKVLCTESRAKRMIVVVSCLCLAVTLPTAFEWRVVTRLDPATNATRVEAEASELAMHPVYVSVYYWVVTVLYVFIPLLLLAVFNAFLIRSVHSSKSQRKRMTRRREVGSAGAESGGGSQESKITVMLIAVVILFLVCQVPSAITLLYKAFHKVQPATNEDALLRGMGNIFNFLMAVNAAGNFVLYCLLSRKYRSTFLLLFCPCRRRHQPPATATTVYTTVVDDHKIGGQSTIRSNKQNQLSFSNKVKVFNHDEKSPEGHHRLLRGFRLPWRRTKVASSGEEDRKDQFIPLKLQNDCTNTFVPDESALHSV